MGESRSVTWMAGLSLYFFLFFAITYSFLQGAEATGIEMGDISVSDPGFQTSIDPFVINATCSGSLPLSAAFCSGTNANSNESCTFIPGCSWDGTDCNGIPDLSAFGGGCSSEMNETMCRILDCAWVGYNSETGQAIQLNDAVDQVSIKEAMAVMSGFDADIGVPAAYRFFFSFLLFWLPGFVLMASIYFSLPFVH